jgi:hypothetical protein
MRVAKQLALLAVVLAAAFASAAPALAAPPERPEPYVVEPKTATTALFRVLLDESAAAFPVEPGTYEFLYKATKTVSVAECESAGASRTPVPPGMYLGLEPEKFEQEVTGLTPATEYVVCPLAENDKGEQTIGEAVSFETNPEAPETGEAGEIEGTSARLEGALEPAGAKLRYEFTYNLGASCAGGFATPLSEGEGDVAAVITGLTPDSKYTFCLLARTAAGNETSGEGRSFETPPEPPTVSESASQVTATGAVLEAELDPDGLATTYHFEYDTVPYLPGEAAHGVSTPEGSAGAGIVDVARGAVIQGLTPSTTYYYRVVAENRLGKVEGENETFITQGGAASVLPDGRQWELVSPPNKHGAPLESLTEEGGLIQSAAGGGAFAYVALGPPETDPKGVRSPHDSQLIATRGPDGWETEDITTPHEEISILHVGFPSEYKFFSDDLRASVVEPQGSTPLSPQTTERTPYRREANGEFVPLVSTSDVPAGTEFGGVETPVQGTGQFSGGVVFRTATPDLSRVLLESPQALAPGFAPGFEVSTRENVYELDDGEMRLISVLPNETPASESGVSASVGGASNLDLRGSISADGERVVFETNAGEGLYVRDLGLAQTVLLNEAQAGAPGGLQGELAVFQAADTDDSRVLFTDASRLTTDATAQPGKPDLYMCEVSAALSAGERDCSRHLTDLSVDGNPGEAANVAGKVSAIDTAGEHIYFAASGVLRSTPNARGERALPGDCDSETEAQDCNLYEYDLDTKQTVLVAVLSSIDSPDWGGHAALGLAGLTARSSPDGHYFTFMSQRSLTGYDNRDARSAQRDEEVFLLNADSGKLSCVSCDPTGGRPDGVFDVESFPGLLVDHPKSWGNSWLAGSIPAWTLGPSHTEALYQSRYLSNSGRMFFNAADALVPQDTNNLEDVYEYEPVGGAESGGAESAGRPASNSCTTASSTYSASSGGCVSLISSGTSKEESAFLDASENGDDVFFLTASRLTSSDVDSAFDVYDAHACSAESPCPPPPPAPAPACEGDACQAGGALNQSPTDATPGSLTFHGPGNLAPPAAVKAKAKPLTRAQKLAKALKACKKKPKKQRAGCEKQARKKYGPLKKAKKKARK